VHVVCCYLETHAEGEWEEDEDEKHGQPHQQVTTYPNASILLVIPVHFCNHSINQSNNHSISNQSNINQSIYEQNNQLQNN
jgi:hypothetical protein